MSNGYTRQSVFIDGDVILAEHGNLEFDWLVNVFSTTGGHNHDGSAGAGDFIPILKDLTEVQDFQLTTTGVTGSVVLDEDDLVSDSNEHLATQQSIKAYVDLNRTELDTVDTDLQQQIDDFATSNHTHSWKLRNVDFTAAINEEYQTLATTGPVDITLDTIAQGNGYVIHNSVDSTQVVQVLNPTATIKGPKGDIPSGTDLILEPGDTVSLAAQSSTILEVA